MMLQRIYERRFDLLFIAAVHSLRNLLAKYVVHRSIGLLQVYRSLSGSGTAGTCDVLWTCRRNRCGLGTLSEEFDCSRHSSCPPKRLWCALAAVRALNIAWCENCTDAEAVASGAYLPRTTMSFS